MRLCTHRILVFVHFNVLWLWVYMTLCVIVENGRHSSYSHTHFNWNLYFIMSFVSMAFVPGYCYHPCFRKQRMKPWFPNCLQKKKWKYESIHVMQCFLGWAFNWVNLVALTSGLRVQHVVQRFCSSMMSWLCCPVTSISKLICYHGCLKAFM